MEDQAVKRGYRGRFLPGTAGGPGRPRLYRDEERERALAALRESTVPLLQTVIAQAAEGCRVSQKLILDRVSPVHAGQSADLDHRLQLIESALRAESEAIDVDS